MNDDAKAILRSLLAEIEDLRAELTVVVKCLEVLPAFSQVDMKDLKRMILEKNLDSYKALREAIDELA